MIDVCMCSVLHIDTVVSQLRFLSMVLHCVLLTTAHQSPAGLASSLLDAHGWSIPDLQGPELTS